MAPVPPGKDVTVTVSDPEAVPLYVRLTGVANAADADRTVAAAIASLSFMYSIPLLVTVY
jgi:hypothetical protein